MIVSMFTELPYGLERGMMVERWLLTHVAQHFSNQSHEFALAFKIISTSLDLDLFPFVRFRWHDMWAEWEQWIHG